VGSSTFGKGIKGRLENCVFCSRRVVRRKKSDSCHFLMGSVAGIVSTIYGWPYQAYEEKCGFRGDPLCEVSLDEEFPPAKSRVHWGLSVLFPDLHGRY